MEYRSERQRRGRCAVLRVLAASLVLSVAGCAEAAYRYMNDPSRDVWQRPAAVVEALAISQGDRVADVGAGGGYFTWRLADAAGSTGRVYAVEVDETALRLLREDVRARNLGNVEVLRASPGDAGLPEPVDLLFLADTYHHMSDRVQYFRSAARYLKPGGRVAIVEFHDKGLFSGLLGHGTAKERVREEMDKAGYRAVADHDFLERQHFQVFQRAELTP